MTNSPYAKIGTITAVIIALQVIALSLIGKDPIGRALLPVFLVYPHSFLCAFLTMTSYSMKRDQDMNMKLNQQNSKKNIIDKVQICQNLKQKDS